MHCTQKQQKHQSSQIVHGRGCSPLVILFQAKQVREWAGHIYSHHRVFSLAEGLVCVRLTDEAKNNNSHILSIPWGEVLKWKIFLCTVNALAVKTEHRRENTDTWNVGQMLWHNKDSSLFKWQTHRNPGGWGRGFKVALQPWKNIIIINPVFVHFVHFSSTTNRTQWVLL